jgi:hypothetical protein
MTNMIFGFSTIVASGRASRRHARGARIGGSVLLLLPIAENEEHSAEDDSSDNG